MLPASCNQCMGIEHRHRTSSAQEGTMMPASGNRRRKWSTNTIHLTPRRAPVAPKSASSYVPLDVTLNHILHGRLILHQIDVSFFI